MSEADSPRGRIAQMRGVASGHIPINQRFIQHMDRCLTCRSCEAVCPNHVAYGPLIDKTRSMIAASTSTSSNGKTLTRKFWLRRLIEKEFIAKPTRFDKLRLLLFFYQKIGLQELLKKLVIFKKTKIFELNAQLPKIKFPRAISSETGTSKSWKKIYLPTGKPCGEVGLFLGCIARLTDTETINASIYVLNRLGYTVHIPPIQTCCGALHQHGGDTKIAIQLAKQNVAAFDGLNVKAIITTSSGCSIRLADYHSEFSAKVIDISKFLISAGGWHDIKVTPLQNKVLVHDPCTLRNILRSSKYPYELLMRIPGIQVTPLAGNDQCCGAAGTYFLDQPVMAKALLNDKISKIDNDARYLVTSNIGCNMHISSALQDKIPELEILHPVTLLARQMGMPT
jgi:glycolate oxidase iron-sulfur subunit